MNKSKQNGGKPQNNNNNNNNSNNKSKNKKKRSKDKDKREFAQIAAPVAYSQKQEFPNRERMTSRRIRNSEFISTITGSVTFDASQKFVINPGLVGSFPWLSVLAAEWQQYRIHKLCFRYVTRTSTSSVGSVILSPDYNVVDVPPSSEQIASNTQDAVEDVCWRSITCHLDVAAMFPFGPRKQIRTGNITGDYTTYDAGRLFVCVTGQSSAADIGKLWVDYDVELFVPQSSPQQAVSSGSNSALFTLSADTVITVSTLTTIAFNSSLFNNLSITNSSGVFTPPSGGYLLQLSFTGNTNAASTSYTTTGGIYKNGVLDSSIIDCNYSCTGSTNTWKPAIPAIGYVSCNGTDTIEIKVTVACAGVPSILTETRLFWSLA